MNLVAQLPLVALTLVALGLLAWRGRRADRIAAGAFLAVVLLSPLVQGFEAGNIRWAVAGLSVGLLLVLVCLSLKVERWWLLVASGCQLLAVGTYGLSLANPDLLIWSGVTLRGFIWLQLMMACLFGAWEAGSASRAMSRATDEHGLDV